MQKVIDMPRIAVHLLRIALYRVSRMESDLLRWAFRVRNRVLRNRPIYVHVGKPLKLHPWGATAFDCWSRRRFERHELSLVLGALRPGMTFLDVGSNVGLFALSAATLNPDVLIYAFEPSKSTCRVLKRNIRLNGVSNVIPIQYAVGDTVGHAVIHENPAGWDGLNTLGTPSHPDSRIVRTDTVDVITLDKFVKEVGLTSVDVIKVDVEGAELMVFRGALELLQRADAPMIVFENYSWCTRGFSYHPVENLWLLQSCGYDVYAIDQKSGNLIPYPTSGDYSAMTVAVKPHHRSIVSRYSKVAP